MRYLNAISKTNMPKYLDIKKGACGPGNVYSTFANNNFLKRTTDNNEKLHNPQIFECPHQLGCEKHTGTRESVSPVLRFTGCVFRVFTQTRSILRHGLV